ncbi:hypothetical protein ACF3MZ_18215 [Paenibacillaceae bacterium WGS1546]|uniref:hypothetical protein n=1 Tax=Cohnella sp. WGS1546 TaxID=3366810 RepID=UPI00372D30BE
MKMPKCALCEKEATLENSHIISKFVYRYIVKNSATGYMRSTENVNKRLQDGDKRPMLCSECEDLFSKNETAFANKIFHPFQNNSITTFDYDNWLNYFISSVNWRNLYLDILDFVVEKNIPVYALEVLIKAERILRDYLLGKRNDIDEIENHIFFFDTIERTTDDISAHNPHVFFRTSSFGYTYVTYGYGEGYYVYSNLAGILICTLIKKSVEDKWENTYIQPNTGKLLSPQYVKSPLMGEVMVYMKEYSSKREMSEKQMQAVLEQMKKDPDRVKRSNSFKFRQYDKNLRRE